MIKNVTGIIDLLKHRLKFFSNIKKTEGFVIKSDNLGVNFLNEILNDSELPLHIVQSTGNELNDYVDMVKKADETNSLILSTVTRENLLLIRNYNKRIELGKDLFIFADLYFSEVAQVIESLGSETVEVSEEYKEAEDYARLAEKLTGQVNGDQLYHLKSALTGTPLGNENVLAKLDEYGKKELETREKFNNNLVTIQIRGQEGLVE